MSIHAPCLILSAGMPRSASTWLYNIARLLISRDPRRGSDFGFGWIADWNSIDKRSCMLIKLHDFEPEIARRACTILYSYRDVRDAVASQHRKSGSVASLELVGRYIRAHENWMKHSHFQMRYESMIEAPEMTARRVAEVLAATNVIALDWTTGPDIARVVVAEVDKLSYTSEGSRTSSYNLTNLYHNGHITDGRVGAWKGTLHPDKTRRITKRYGWWLEKYGYAFDP